MTSRSNGTGVSAKANGVTLERRISVSMRVRCLGNMRVLIVQFKSNETGYSTWIHCMIGFVSIELRDENTALVIDARLNCARSTRNTSLHYTSDRQPPQCVIESERVMCPNVSDRECFYPDSMPRIEVLLFEPNGKITPIRAPPKRRRYHVGDDRGDDAGDGGG